MQNVKTICYTLLIVSALLVVCIGAYALSVANSPFATFIFIMAAVVLLMTCLYLVFPKH